MAALISLAAALPIGAVVLAIVLFRRSAVVSSALGLAVAFALVLSLDTYRMGPTRFAGALAAGLILSLSAVLVILPGLYLTSVLRAQGVLARIVSWIEALRIRPERKAVVLMVGFVPAVESLTGFGVSLLLSVPIFMKLFPRVGLELALMGMNIMPWGTLALATTVGAALIGTSPRDLGTATSLTSALVFPYLAAVTLVVVGGTRTLLREGLFALTIGGLLSLLLYLSNRLLEPQTAGVIAGLLAGLVGLVLARRPGLQPANLAERLPVLAFLPYLAVVALVLVTRLIPPVRDLLANTAVLASGSVRFSPLSSPGLILLVVALAMHAVRPVPIPSREVLTRAWRAGASVTAFLILSQVMLLSGMIGALARALLGITGGAVLAVGPALAMLSGFVAGSNVGGNALFMTMLAQVGHAHGDKLLFAAIQNSGAGHAVFTSIPIIALVLAIARGEGELPDIQERHLLRFGLRVAVGIYLAIVAAAGLVQSLGLLSG